MTVLAAWLIVTYRDFRMARQQVLSAPEAEATRRIEREVMFNEKILANMPSGIAFVDPTSRRFLQANEAFMQMAQRFGEVPPGCDISGSHLRRCEDCSGGSDRKSAFVWHTVSTDRGSR